MTTLREAAEQALDYWEQVAWGDAVMVDKMDALKAALAEQAQPLRDLCAAAYQVVGVADGPVEMLDNLWAAAEGKPLPHDPGAGLPWSQPSPQPVAWMVYTEDGKSAYVTDNPTDLIGAYRALPLYTTPPAPVHQPVHGWTDADADAARLALELECLLTDKDVPLSAASRWWDSAHEALRLHRERLAAAPEAPTPPAPQRLTIEKLRDALVASRVIDPGAVEDPDTYDDGVMLARIEALFRRIA